MKLNFSIILLLSLALVICFSLETQDEGEFQFQEINNKDEPNDEEVQDEIIEPEMSFQEFLDEEPCKEPSFLRRSSDPSDTGDSPGLLDMLSGVADAVKLDSVWSWFGGNDQQEIGEDCEINLVEKNGEDIIQDNDDNKFYFKAVKPYKEENSRTGDEYVDDDVSDIALENGEVLQTDQEIVVEKYETIEEMINEIDEIVVTVPLDDILGATSYDDIEAVAESGEPFYIRVYELFMGRETEVGIHNAEFYQPKNQSEGKRLRTFLNDDGL